MLSNDPNEQILLGILAVEMKFAPRQAVVAAVRAWSVQRTASLDQILIEQLILAEPDAELLRQLVQRQITLHDNDVEKAIAAVACEAGLRQELSTLPGPHVEATVSLALPPSPVAAANNDGKGDAESENGADPYATRIEEAAAATSLRYRILRPHARGGLGEVFIAEDEELHREVALKQIQQRYADHTEYRSRFIVEAEVTGSLEHPGIVPIYGMGSYEDGRPFYAMRLIRGTSLKHAIDQFYAKPPAGQGNLYGQLEMRKLLARVVDVCEAIEYAHSRGVLHRDLKPANIMLGSYGETLVVDWGLAKAAGRSDSGSLSGERPLQLSSQSGSAKTSMGSALGTPQYMSPEQAAGRLDLVNALSDVYCLGATLYHVLTGRAPVNEKDVGEMLQRVERGDFPPPRAICPRIPLPLEAICLKAMQREPRDRYPSARALADDLENWMADEAVVAHRETRLQRMGRWLRKHRTFARVAAVSTLLITAVAIVAAVWINHARASEAAARQKAVLAKSEAVAAFQKARDSVDVWLTGASEMLHYYPGMQAIRQKMLEQAVVDYTAFAEQHSDDPGLEIERARAQLRLGDLQRALRRLPAAEAAYREAIAITSTKLPDATSQEAARLELASAHVKLGLFFAELGKTSEADQQYEIATSEAIECGDAMRQRKHEVLASAYLNRGELRRHEGDRAHAQKLLQAAIHTLSGAQDSTRQRFSAATAESVLAQILADSDQTQSAVEHFEAASKRFAVLVEREPDNPEMLQSLADTQLGLAAVRRKMGAYDKELAAYREALRNYQALERAVPNSPVVLEGAALTRTDLALLLHHLGDNVQASAELKLAIPVFADLEDRAPAVPRYREELAAARDLQGQVLYDQGEYAEARNAHEQAYKKCVALATEFPDVPDYRQRQGIAQSNLAQALQQLKLATEAQAEFTAAIEKLDEAAGLKAEAIQSACIARGHFWRLLQSQNQPELAAAVKLRAWQDWQRLIERSGDPEYAHDFARFLTSIGELDRADAKTAVDVATTAVQAAPQNPFYRGTLAAAYYRSGNAERCRDLLTDSESPAKPGEHSFYLAMSLAKLGQMEKAEHALSTARKWFDEQVPGNFRVAQLAQEASQVVQVSKPAP